MIICATVAPVGRAVDLAILACDGQDLYGSMFNVRVRAALDPEAQWWTTSDVAAYLGVQVPTVSGVQTAAFSLRRLHLAAGAGRETG